LIQQEPHIIRPMAKTDLETVLVWRNHENVRCYMYTQHEISLEEHSQWFERASIDPKRHLLIYEAGSKPQGFINIHEIAPGGIADWGFYAAPDTPKGTGRALASAALRHAFITLGLHKLCGQVIAFNERSIQFHLRLGFLQEGIFQQQHFDGQNYHDVWCFGLLADHWQAIN
jgi:UDP-4-amino-4,6-dideoxy-N-acetyl-beta-L-altrosamine N-acetyltransferase